MSFAEKLIGVRKSKNLSQDQLAETLNVPRQSVAKWEEGDGYPDVETLIVFAQKYRLSLDNLLLGETIAPKKTDPDTKSTSYSGGKISIRTFDGSAIVNCYKVFYSQIITSSKRQPKFVLNGVDSTGFWGEKSNTLGWYTTKELVQKEVNQIMNAISNGESTYELQYAAKVKVGLTNILLDE